MDEIGTAALPVWSSWSPVSQYGFTNVFQTTCGAEWDSLRDPETSDAKTTKPSASFVQHTQTAVRSCSRRRVSAPSASDLNVNRIRSAWKRREPSTGSPPQLEPESRGAERAEAARKHNSDSQEQLRRNYNHTPRPAGRKPRLSQVNRCFQGASAACVQHAFITGSSCEGRLLWCFKYKDRTQLNKLTIKPGSLGNIRNAITIWFLLQN